MIFLRALRPLVPHIVILGLLAALYHVIAGIEKGSTSLALDAVFGFSWHALAQIAVALPIFGVIFLCARVIRMWRWRKLRRFLRELE
jgi:TRAP-type C4-dicarboxylate transport system permease small subunit